MIQKRHRALLARFAGLLSFTIVLSALFASTGSTLPAVQSSTTSSFDRLAQVENLRALFAEKAVKAIGLTSPQYHPDLPYSGLSRTQANSVLAIAERFGSQDFTRAVRVAWCESRLNPNSVSPKNRNGSRDHGLFQLNDDGTMQRLGVTHSTALDISANVNAAWVLLQDRGWKPWTCAHALGIAHMKMLGEVSPSDPALKAAEIANKKFHAAKATKLKAAKAAKLKAAKIKAAKAAKLKAAKAAKLKAAAIAKAKAEKDAATSSKAANLEAAGNANLKSAPTAESEEDIPTL